MATKIKLTRIGKMREPHYRIVVADSRTKRDGRSIETIGEYHPKSDPSIIRVDGDRAAYWLGVGAQPTEAVAAIFKVTGDWQKFKGEEAPPPMLMAPEKADKQALFHAALAEVDGEPATDATTPKKKASKKTADKPAEDAAATTEDAPAKTEDAPAKTEDAKAEDDPAKAEKAKAEKAKTEDAKAVDAPAKAKDARPESTDADKPSSES